jgi:DNA-binding CsgD family transcriptional regulator
VGDAAWRPGGDVRGDAMDAGNDLVDAGGHVLKVRRSPRSSIPIPWDTGCILERMDRRVDAEVRRIVRGCYLARDDLASLRSRLLERIRRVVTIEAAFFAAADPETLLFTSVSAEAPLTKAAPLFLANEFGVPFDVNRFALLAGARRPVATLDEATGGDREASPRFREIMAPLQLGDELRVALRTGETTWGFLCLHREGKTGFSERDIAVLTGIAPHAGEALRRIVAGSIAMAQNPHGDPAVVLTQGNVVIGMTGAAASWLDELHGSSVEAGAPIPFALLGVVRRLEQLESTLATDPPPRLTIATRRGSLLEVHAARMRGAEGKSGIAITLAPAGAAARSSLLLAARGLTPAQRRVAALVLRGLSTREMVSDLGISEHTVQDHLKAVFEKVGVGSRRELVAVLLH